jgi:surfactin synthase thioesterase subunit
MSIVKLFCLPFAGGNKYSYRDYELNAPPYIQVVPLEYPGRGSRVKEGFETDMQQLVEKMYQDVKDDIGDTDYAIYGHSMGGIVAFFLVKKLLENNYRPPLHLFITGTTGPSSNSIIEKKRHLMTKPDFIEEIRKLDGCPEEILQNDELLDYFEPILRADFQVSETYSYEFDKPFDLPVTVITGTEEDMKEEDIQLWQKETTQAVDFRKMPGKHFFIFDYPKQVIDLVSRKIVNIVKSYQ